MSHLSRSNSTEAFQTVNRTAKGEPHLQRNFEMDTKLLKSYEKYSGRDAFAGSAFDARQQQSTNPRGVAGNSHHSGEVSNLNARCHSFENKYRILTQ